MAFLTNEDNFPSFEDDHKDQDDLLQDISYFKTVFHDAVKLYKIFIDQYRVYDEVPPSLYIKEMQRTHKERQACLKALHANLAFEHSDVVEIIPPVVIFQGWEPDMSYQVKVTITNKLKNPLNIKVKCETSNYFKLFSPNNQIIKKLAHGITTSYYVLFKARSVRDYEHQLLVTTSFNKIIIPILSIGPRPLVDFPDLINIGDAPVKLLTQRIITLRNIGQVKAVANLTTDSPFAIRPEHISLKPNDVISLTVSFASLNTGIFMGALKVKFDTGDELFIKLVCMAENIKVYFDSDTYTFADSYIGTRRVGEVFLCNDTDHILKFKWHKYIHFTDDMKALINLDNTVTDIVQSSQYTVLAGDRHFTDVSQAEVIADRIETDEMSHANLLNIPFSDPTFEIAPLSGEVMPQSRHGISVIFKPTQTEMHQTIAFCEIEGVDRRFMLQLQGTGIGPMIIFDVDVIDFGVIFLSLEHSYEFSVKNIGPITGEVRYTETKMSFGGFIKCNPSVISIFPGKVEVICVTLSSNLVGAFLEEITFTVLESQKKFRIVLKGTIVCPKLKICKKVLDFGAVSFGFPISQSITLTNESPCAIPFELEVKDGTEPAFVCWDYAKENAYKVMGTMLFYTDPKEISFEPTSGTIEPDTSVDVKVVLLPNITRVCSKPIRVLLWGSDYPEMHVTLKYVAEPAVVHTFPKTIEMRYAFINFEYTTCVYLENTSDVSSFFVVPHDKGFEENGLRITFNQYFGIMKPKSIFEFVMTVVVLDVGYHEKEIIALWVSDTEVKKYERKLRQRFSMVTTIPDTRKHHCYIPIEGKTMKIKITSLSTDEKVVDFNLN